MSLWNSPGGGRTAQNYGSTQQGFGGMDSPSRVSSDTPQRYHQLCDNISSAIFSINNDTATLERASRQLGTQADTDAFREKLHMTQQNANLTIKSTTSALQELGTLVAQGDKQQKLQSSRLRNEFQEVVKRYSSLQKTVATRQKYTMYARPSAAAKPSGGGGTQTGGWFDSQPATSDETAALLDDPGSPQSPTQQQQQQHLRQDMDYEQALLVEREQRIRRIESDMLDCNQIFKDLANIVHEQGDVIDTIEGNIESTQHNTAQAVEQLRSAANYQRKYRRKTCCLLVLVVVGAAVLALVIYFSIK
uniref:Putative snare protein pep12/vam3/syntaxin 7/syntaxin 17 n=1 Tax=Rhipicephalus pulchellus TaxID=72859 RepID=L7M445_RHIPC